MSVPGSLLSRGDPPSQRAGQNSVNSPLGIEGNGGAQQPSAGLSPSNPEPGFSCGTAWLPLAVLLILTLALKHQEPGAFTENSTFFCPSALSKTSRQSGGVLQKCGGEVPRTTRDRGEWTSRQKARMTAVWRTWAQVEISCCVHSGPAGPLALSHSGPQGFQI